MLKIRFGDYYKHLNRIFIWNEMFTIQKDTGILLIGQGK